ncbi:hypothetical protein Hanom_Chr01g00005881 [Helianthus anomalus]
MASGGAKPAIFFLLFVNLILYLIIMIIASWAVNHGIEESLEQGTQYLHIMAFHVLTYCCYKILSHLRQIYKSLSCPVLRNRVNTLKC